MAAVIRKLHVGGETGQTERAEALAKARETIVGAKSDLLAAAAPTATRIDPVANWKADGERRLAEERAARSERRQEERRELRRQQQGADQWVEWVAAEIRKAVAAEHERMVEIVAGVLAEERERTGENLETKIKALELQIGELKGLLRERIGEVAEKSGAAFLSLSQRLTEIEKNAVGMKVQIDTAEKMSTEAATFFRKMFTG
jgi:hypothetical protein